MYTITNKDITDLLVDSLKQREREVFEYQFNIDNFKIIVEKIGDNPKMQEYKEQVLGLLEGHTLEQCKAQLVLDTILDRLAEQKVDIKNYLSLKGESAE